MRKLLLTGVAVLALAACSDKQLASSQATLNNVKTSIGAIEVQALQAADMACKTDQQIVPFVQAGAAIVPVPQVQAWVALDASTVHPAITAACAALGGIVVAPPKS